MYIILAPHSNFFTQMKCFKFSDILNFCPIVKKTVNINCLTALAYTSQQSISIDEPNELRITHTPWCSTRTRHIRTI